MSENPNISCMPLYQGALTGLSIVGTTVWIQVIYRMIRIIPKTPYPPSFQRFIIFLGSFRSLYKLFVDERSEGLHPSPGYLYKSLSSRSLHLELSER